YLRIRRSNQTRANSPVTPARACLPYLPTRTGSTVAPRSSGSFEGRGGGPPLIDGDVAADGPVATPSDRPTDPPEDAGPASAGDDGSASTRAGGAADGAGDNRPARHSTNSASSL